MSSRQLDQIRLSGFFLSRKLRFIAVVGGIAILLLSIAAIWSLRTSIIKENVAKVHALSEVAHDTANFFYRRAQQGEFSDETARQLTRTVLRELNYGAIDAFFIYDFAGNGILLTQKPDREGQNWLDLKDEDGVYPVQQLLYSARHNGQPVYYKLYPRNDSSTQKMKLSVALQFEPWGWAIGTGIYMADIEKQFWTAALRMGSFIVSIASLFGLIAWLLVRNIAKTFNQQTELLHEYYKSAQTDPMTGCNNRRSFLEMGERDFALAKRHNNHLSVLMLDIDHFKQINDRHGHSFGDQVICTMVNEILKSIRITDVFGRVGGEEFALVLPETDVLESQVIAEKLRALIADLKLMDNTQEVRFTTSVGVACMHETDNSFAELLARADQALYCAKDKGRNCVCVK